MEVNIFYSRACLTAVGLVALRLQADSILTSCDEAQLRAALSQGGRVILACEGTIPITQPLVIATNITLEAARSTGSSPGSVTLDGQYATSLLRVETNGRLNLIGLALTRGRAPRGAAIFNDGGTVTISNCSFTAHIATAEPSDTSAGGAIYGRGGQLTIWQSQFSGNRTAGGRFLDVGQVEARGGAISQEGGQLRLDNCLFETNSAAGGVLLPQPPAQQVISGPALGGAIALADVEAFLSECIFQKNRVESTYEPSFFLRGGDVHGGALHYEGLSRVRLESCRFIENLAIGGGVARNGSPGKGFGGAISSFGPLLADDCLFRSNTVTGGGGSLSGRGDALGGALYTSNATVRACTFLSNHASGGQGCYCGFSRNGDAMGGAVFNAGKLEISGSFFSLNWTDAPVITDEQDRPRPGRSLGGGLYNAGECFLTNSTWYQNLAVAQSNRFTIFKAEGITRGAAIYQERGQLFLVHCTVAANVVSATPANASAAMVIGADSVAHFLASIVAENISTNVDGTIIDEGYNLSSDATPSFSAASSLNHTDPGLGGPLTIAGSTFSLGLIPGSRAIDAIPADIRTADIDQRGIPRPIGPGSDIGAFEYLPRPVFEWRDGEFQVERVLRPERNYFVETSSDLESWSVLSVEHSDAAGRLLFRDPAGAATSLRFYRFVE